MQVKITSEYIIFVFHSIDYIDLKIKGNVINETAMVMTLSSVIRLYDKRVLNALNAIRS